MNIILLIVDTLRYDRIAWHGRCPWMKTPNFDRLASRSLVFDNAYAASYPTIPHRTDVMTGRYGLPFHPWAPLAFDQPFMPRALADKGYCTQLMHDTPHLVNGGHAFDYPFHAWTFIRGAEVDRPIIDDRPLTMLDNWCRDESLPIPAEADEQLEHQMIVTYSRANRLRSSPEEWNAAKLFTNASDFLKRNATRDNFFLWLDCFDPHEPWDAPPELVRQYDTTEGYDGRIDPRLFTGATRRDPEGGQLPQALVRRQTALYDAKVSWVDQWFGRLLDTLADTGLDKNTALIVTADHGTNLHEWGLFGKSGPAREFEAHVPLLVCMPDGPTGRSDRIAQPQDITATLLDIGGAGAPDWCQGTSLLETKAAGRELALCGGAIGGWPKVTDWPAFSVIEDTQYLVMAPDPAYDRLHKLGSTEDIASQAPQDATRLRKAGLAELQARECPQDVLDWYRSGGKKPMPEVIGRAEFPEGWRQYFTRIYKKWE